MAKEHTTTSVAELVQSLPKKTKNALHSFFGPPFKALGLGFIIGLVSKGPEEPKEVLVRSRWKSVSGHLIHILPVAGLVVMIWINYIHFFIGPTFVEDPTKDRYFSWGILFAAKVEELLCVASLTSIVLRALRHELLGDGLPIGLIGSGLYFHSIESIWSTAFLGACPRVRTSGWRRWRLYVLIVICAGVAFFIGPSSGYLMKPRNQNVPAGGVSFYHNATADQLWPGTVTSDFDRDLCSHANATAYDVCPSGGFRSLSQTWGSFQWASICDLAHEVYSPLCQARGVEGNRQWDNLLITSPTNLVPPVLNSIRTSFWSSNGTTAIQPHAATTVVMKQLRKSWMEYAVQNTTQPYNHQFKWTYDLQTLGSATSPYVRALCLNAQNLTANATEAQFPYLLARPLPDRGQANFNVWARGQNKTASLAGLNLTASSLIRTQWMSLPIDAFGDPSRNASITGLLVELPWVGGSRIGVTCAIAAAWHNTTLQSLRSNNYDAFTIVLSPFDFEAHDDSPDADGTNRPIMLDQSWLDLLTPTAGATAWNSNPSGLNTLESILDGMGISTIPGQVRLNRGLINDQSIANKTDQEVWWMLNDPGHKVIEPVVASMVADGLSRYRSSGYWRTQGLPIISNNQSSILKHLDDKLTPIQDAPYEWMQLYAVGWAYEPSGTTDALVLTVACVYLALIASYLVYAICRGVHRKGPVTSSAWGSLTELLVLMQNSQPPSATGHALDNTAVGIEHMKTYNAVVKLRAIPPKDANEPPRLTLVLDDGANVKQLEVESDVEKGAIAHPASAINHSGSDISSEFPFVPIVEGTKYG